MQECVGKQCAAYSDGICQKFHTSVALREDCSHVKNEPQENPLLKVKTAEPIVGKFGYSNDFLDKMLEKLLYGKRRSNSKS